VCSSDLLDGRVASVSADALLDPRSGAAYFAVQVEVDAAHVRDAGLPPLTPGMAAEVYLRTSSRTPLEFLLEPLTAGMRRGFREH
jgi:multidrug efflux pump subunit AcrA (membrane-fusion protein)